MAEATTSSQGTTLPRPANEGCPGWWNLKDANGNTPLHLAAQNGHLAVIKSLLGLGSVIEERNLKGQTPLMLAVYAGQEEATRCLLEAGADLSTESDDKSSIWHAAAFSGNVAIIQCLSNSKTVHTKYKTYKYPEKPLTQSRNDGKNVFQDINGEKPDKICTKNGENVNDQKGLTKSCKNTDGKKNYSGAADNEARPTNDPRKQHDWEKIYRNSELISSSEPEDEVRLSEKLTSLETYLYVSDDIIAAKDDENREILKCLTDSHLQQFLLDYVTKGTGLTSLHFSAYCGSVRALSYFVSKNVDLNVVDDDGTRPIHLSAVAGNLEAFELLINSGADYNLPDNDGRTALHFAANRKRVSIVKKLLALGVDPCASDLIGNTPLHVAAVRNNNLEVCQILIDNGARLLEKNRLNLTPYDVALSSGQKDLADLLSPFKCC